MPDVFILAENLLRIGDVGALSAVFAIDAHMLAGCRIRRLGGRGGSASLGQGSHYPCGRKENERTINGRFATRHGPRLRRRPPVYLSHSVSRGDREGPRWQTLRFRQGRV